MILFRRHRIVGPGVGIPPEFEPAAIAEGDDTAIWHGFMPVHGVQGLLEDALHELRAAESITGDWGTRALADGIERVLNDWRRLDDDARVQP